ncbi:MAG: Ig-like domain-containing protein [Dinoroseobacter sp.]|nr:Ig-like domain-containing protein [Dinoroseobacter sp.]
MTSTDILPVSSEVSIQLPTEPEGNIVVIVNFGEPVSTVPPSSFDATSVTLTNTNGLSRTDGVATFTDGDSSVSIEFAAPVGGFEQDIDYTASILGDIVFSTSGGGNLADTSDPAGFAIDDAPVFVSAPDQINLLENRGGVIADYSATDPDGDEVSYALSQAGLDAGFTIDPETGQLSAPGAGFDYEAGVLQFSFDVIASSTGTDAVAKTAVQTVTIDLLDENEVLPIEFEFETFDGFVPFSQASSGQFFRENQAAASGGQVGRLAANSEGTATLTLDDTSGVTFGQNTITIDYFDENDGVSSFVLSINGVEVGEVTLNNDGGGNAAQAQNLRTATFTNVNVPEDAVVSIAGQSSAAEFLRIDKVGFLFTGGSTGGSNQPPIAVSAIDLSGLTQGDTINIPLEGQTPIFVDPDSPSLDFTLSGNAPDFLGIVGGAIVNTREITNDDVIASAQTGPITVTVTASDGELNATTTFDLSVANANDAPTVVPENVTNFSFEESDVDIVPIETAVLFDDIDLLIPTTSEELRFEANGLPPELEIDPVTGQITGATTTSGSFQASVTATDTAGEFATANFTITVGEEPVVGNPIRVQVEDFDNILAPDGFFIENQGAADNNQVARLRPGDTGEATLDLTGVSNFAPGTHNILLAFFDENDGASTVTVKIRTPNAVDQVVGEVVFDADAGGNAAQPSSFRQVVLQGIDLPAGATLVLDAQADGYSSAEAAGNPNRTAGKEFVRLDYVELIPTGAGPGNSAPLLAPGFNPALEASEGSATFQVAGAFVDPEQDALTYGLAPVNGSTPVPTFLSINPVTGVLSMTASDVDEDTSFDFLVTATDVGGSGQTASRPFSLNVLDSSLTTVSVEEGNVFVTDIDAPGTGTEFSILPSGDGALFSINPNTGVLSFNSAPDFENPLDGDGDNIYDVTVQAVGPGGTTTQSIAVAVTNVVESSVGYFEGIGSGNNFRFKMQIEDANGGPNGGTDPNGIWTFIAEGDPNDVLRENSQGAGYYRFGGETSTLIEVPSEENGENQLFFRIFIPDDELGIYSFRFRAGRQNLSEIPNDQQNDIWLNFVKEDTPGSKIEDFLLVGSNSAKPVADDYVKIFGGPKDNTFGAMTRVDGFPSRFDADVNVTEGGFYIVQVAGRSQGLYVDAIELYKQGNAPGELASSSQFVVSAPTSPTVENDLTAETVVLGNTLDVSNVFVDVDGNEGQPLDLQAVLLVNGQPVALPSNGISFANNTISVAPDADIGSYTVRLTATDLDSNTATDTFVLTVAEVPDETPVTFTMSAGAQDDQEIGGPLNSSDLEGNVGYVVRFQLPNEISGLTSVTSAILSGVNEDGGAATPTHTVSVKDTLANVGLGAAGAIAGAVQITVSGAPAAAGTRFELGDIADALNDLIASQGALNGGDFVTIVVNGALPRRDVLQGTLQLAIDGFSGEGSGSSNLPPSTSPDSATVAEDGALTNIDVLSNDTDPEGDLPLQLVSVVQPQNGTASTNPDGTINYTPDPNFFGQDTVVYTVIDTAGQQSTGTLTIEVTPVDDPAVANDDQASTETNTAVQIAVLSNDTDPDGEAPTLAGFDTTSEQGGTITNNGGVLTYTPAIDFEGADSFEYTVAGGDTATVNVTVTSEPQPAAGIGRWEFNPGDPTKDETVQDNSAIFQNGASASGGEVQLDGVDDFIEIPDLDLYDLTDGGLAMTFTVDELNGVDNGTSSPRPSLELNGLFSRDSGGFDGGGHVSAWVDGDGSIVIRHQTTSGSNLIETAAGVVQAGQEMSIVYTASNSEGMALYLDDGAGNLTLIGQNAGANVDFAGNDEPWVIGALQSNSGNGVADNLHSFFDGSIDEFQLFDGDGDFNF